MSFLRYSSVFIAAFAVLSARSPNDVLPLPGAGGGGSGPGAGGDGGAGAVEGAKATVGLPGEQVTGLFEGGGGGGGASVGRIRVNTFMSCTINGTPVASPKPSIGGTPNSAKCPK